MPRKKATKKRPSRDPSREQIREQADSVARRHGLPVGRVKKVLAGLQKAGWTAPKYSNRESVFDEIVSFLGGAEKALEFLESEDLHDLARRVALADFFEHPRTPLYSLSELALLAESFIAYLSQNREALLETGHPRTHFFDYSPWFDLWLARLYYVKIPVVVRRTQGSVIDQDNEYVWSKERLQDIDFIHTDPPWLPVQFTEVPYEQAPLIFDEETGALLKEWRPRIFDMKIRILRVLADAAQVESADGLFEKCLRIMTDVMNRHDVLFFSQIDQRLQSSNVLTWDSIMGGMSGFMGGGVTNLIEIVGNFQKEIEIGTLAKTKQALEELLGSPRLTGGNRIRGLDLTHYLDAVTAGNRETIDSGIDTFLSLREQEDDFWTAFAKTANSSIPGGFRDTGAPTPMFRAEDQRGYDPLLAAYIAFGEAWQELKRIHRETGRPLPFPLSILAVKPPEGIQADDDGAIPSRTEGRQYDLTSPNLPGLSCSEDFRSVIHNGKEYSLKSKQAQVFEYLWNRSQNGPRDVSKDMIFEDLQLGDEERVSDLFKGNPAWKALIVPGKTRGTYRLSV